MVSFGALSILLTVSPTPTSNCVLCPMVVPECPPCTWDSRCQILPRTCNSCSSAICQRIFRPSFTTSTVKPTTSTVKPTQTTRTWVEVCPGFPGCPDITTSTVKPTQPASVVYPTDVVVGAASGITAFSFAGMIALFL